eukprot:4722444-Lingulodinium_polyedra.AAC.1
MSGEEGEPPPPPPRAPVASATPVAAATAARAVATPARDLDNTSQKLRLGPPAKFIPSKHVWED